MDKRYELFCLADPLFYESPHASNAATRNFAAAGRPLPPQWRRAHVGEWQVEQPPGEPLPAQGWKIHMSACRDNAESLLARAIDYCVPRNIAFKFLRGPLSLLVRNAKYAPRGASGKLMTIYPRDEASCERILAELEAIVGGEPGPYILSDLRYGAGPLYVRFGAFTERYCQDSGGELVPAVEDQSGNLVPDRRRPTFTVPEWVTVPGFLAPHLAARNAVTTTDLPYQVDRALHFSNGGGVYLGTDKRTGQRVVLKEARPHAGLAAGGSDAVARLRREHDTLRRLAGLGVAPEALGYFEAGGHHFLVEEYIEGATLNSLYAQRHPMIETAPSQSSLSSYTRWALHVCSGVERAVEAIHSRCVVVNDLHMFNIMVRPDDSVALIDFEAAAPVSEGARPVLGNPGFLPPRDRNGFGIDRYSLACVKLAMFLPLTMLFPLDAAKPAHLAEVIAEHFPVPPGFLDQAIREITGKRPGEGDPARGASAAPPSFSAAARPAKSPAPAAPPFGAETHGRDGWERARQSLTRAILASATPSRDDRLYPGDIDQFAVPGGGLCLAHGAAGVLYALAEAGSPGPADHVGWLADRVREPVAGARLGLYDGMTGVAWALERLGCTAAALRVAEFSLAEHWERLGSDLHGGLSGIALALLDVGDRTGEPRLREAGLRAAGIVADQARRPGVGGQARNQEQGEDPGPRGPGRAGLLRGRSGQALLFIRMFDRTGDRDYLDLAAAALADDLERCVLSDRGALQVNEGWRVMPYLDGGSAGIGMVIGDYLARRDNERFRQAAAQIQVAACSAYYAQSGLFQGRAGLMLYLAHSRAPAGAADDPRIAAHVRRLAWHAIGYQGGTAFPGDGLFRLSMDLATGTAGVLLSLAAALSGWSGALPFQSPLSRSAAPDTSGTGDPTDVPGSACQGLGHKPLATNRR